MYLHFSDAHRAPRFKFNTVGGHGRAQATKY